MDFMRNGRNWEVNGDEIRGGQRFHRSGGVGHVRSEVGALVNKGTSNYRGKPGKNDGSRNVITRDDINTESLPSRLTQWTEWGQQSYTGCNGEVSSRYSEGELMAGERESLRTKEVLMQYKSYVEQRLMGYIKELEEDRAKGTKLCERLKRDNVLLLEELDRFRPGTIAAQCLRRQRHTWHDEHLYPSCSNVQLPSQQSSGELFPQTGAAAPYNVQTLGGCETRLLEQLQKERAKQAQLEAVHADTVARLQQHVAQLEQDRRYGVDAHTIQNLRNVLAQRDDEIQQLRNLHTQSPSAPSRSGQQSRAEVMEMDSQIVLQEIQHMASDAMEFIFAMNDTVSTTTTTTTAAATAKKVSAIAAVTNTTNTDLCTNVTRIEDHAYFADVGHMWEDIYRLSGPNMDGAFNAPYQSSHLLSVARLLHRALEEEQNQIALLVRNILRVNEELRVQLTREQRRREMERQVSTQRLKEVEEAAAAQAQQLQQQLHLTIQRGSSWMDRSTHGPLSEQEKIALILSGHTQKCDVGTQTLLSVELSQFMQDNKGLEVVPTSISKEQFMNQLSQILREMEALEKDNTEKSVLLAHLQQQRKRFLAGVDTELAHSLPLSASLTASFSQYLLE